MCLCAIGAPSVTHYPTSPFKTIFIRRGVGDLIETYLATPHLATVIPTLFESKQHFGYTNPH